ncbi:MAG: galactokinase [Candidatus Binatia bacterium]|nr:galactokinase [Candidatus Binatia bacterium]
MNPTLSVTPWREVADQKQVRLRSLAREFQRRFGRAPQVFVLAPGRVNLIGEHTDYNGYPVLPAALDREVAVAAAGRPDDQVVAHTMAPGFGPCAFSLAEPLCPGIQGDWGNYVKAAANVPLARSLRQGADLLIDSTVPSGAGLSSSSALVVGVGLALLACGGAAEGSRIALAEEFAAAEHFVGTMSGGMDQACCLLGQSGCALRIDFFPLRVRSVPFLPDYRIVVCHSLVTAEKAASVRRAYNLRVWECGIAARALKVLLRGDADAVVERLADVERLIGAPSRRDLLAMLADYIPDRPLSVIQLAGMLRVSPAKLLPPIEPPPVSLETPLPILRRTRHVLREADRVDAAERALIKHNVSALDEAMRTSHASCRDDYEVSCDELEVLVGLSAQAGAIGPRLTGAGFGGCTVQLVPEKQVPEFFRWIDQHFYLERLPSGSLPASYRFAFEPADGAQVVWCEDRL